MKTKLPVSARKQIVSNKKTLFVLFITFSFSGIFFSACKKDTSSENSNNRVVSNNAVTDSALVSAARHRNQGLIVKAGEDQIITLPANSVNFDASGSSDDRGIITSYVWTKVSGAEATIESPDSAQTAVTGLTGGSYKFRLNVIDNNGTTGTDTIHVTVNGTSGSTNQLPIVNAGANQAITLPVSAVTLSGSATDPDGTIVSYLWTKVSGTGSTITSPNSASTTITGLTEGSYLFSLIATDNGGASGDMAVTINVSSTTFPPMNQSPVVNAGTDQTTTLTLTSLIGTASDPDGTIASYLWTNVSGTGGTITTPTSSTTTVTGLTEGIYVFSLKATDNLGATAADTITIIVNAVVQPGSGTLTYQNEYNYSSDINSDQLGRGSISTSTYNMGPGSFRSEVRAGDEAISGGYRSEQQYNTASQNPSQGAVEYDVYYENWETFDGGGHSIQWHPNTNGGSAIISLQNYGGKFDVVRDPNGTVTHQPGTLKTCAADTWYHMRWEFKWSSGTDGYCRLYIDGTLYFSFTGMTSDGSGQYLKIGQNRWPFSGNTMQQTSVCYYDNLKIFSN